MADKSDKRKKADQKERKPKEDRYAHLPDDMRELLNRKQELITEVVAIRKDIQKKQDEKDKMLSLVRAEHREVFDELDSKVDKLQNEKDRLTDKLRKLKGGALSLEVTRQRDRLQDVDFLLQQEYHRDQSIRTESAQLVFKIESLTKVAVRKPKYKSAAEISHHLSVLDGKEKSASEKGHADLVKEFGKKKHDLEVALVQMEEYEKKSKALADAYGQIDSLQERKVAAAEAIEKMQAEKKKAKDHFEQLKEERDTTRKAAWEETKKLEAELEVVKEGLKKALGDRRNVTKEKKPVDTTELKELQARRAKINKELDEITAKLPSKSVAVDEDCVDAIIGSGGATITQLEKDFNCIIEVKGHTGNIVIIGLENLDECAEAIESVVEEAKANRLREEIDYNTLITNEIVRDLPRIAKNSGARVSLMREKGKAVFIGNKESIEAAKELFNELIQNCHREEVKVDNHFKYLRISWLKKIEADTGARSVMMNRETESIVVVGRQALVAEAMIEVKKMINSISVKVELPVPKGVQLRLLAGPKGKHVKAIEEETKALVQIDDPVVILGSKESASRAKQLIKALCAEVKREELEIDYAPALHNLLIRVPRAEKNKVTRADDDADHQDETNEKEQEEDEANAAGEKEGDDVEVAATNEEHEDEDEDEKEGDAAEGEKEDGNDEEGGDVKPKRPKRKTKVKREKPPPNFLQKVTMETGCDYILARRNLGKLVCIGKRDAVAAAKEKIVEFLASHKLILAKLPMDIALIRYAMSRTVHGRFPIVHDLRSYPGVEEVRPSPEVGRIDILGSQEGIDSCKAVLREMITKRTPAIGKFEFERGRTRAIIGERGATIQALEKDFKAFVYVDKDEWTKGLVYVVTDSAEQTQKVIEELEKIIAEDKEKTPELPADSEEKGRKGEGRKGDKGEGKGGGKGYRSEGKGGKGRKDGGGKGSKAGKGSKGAKGGKGK